MHFKISEYEREILQRFKKSKYPEIYKMDKTDNILFVETVDFDVCQFLFKGELINKNQYNSIMNDYKKFISQIDVSSFDDYALAHYNDILQIMKIFKKYYDEN